MSLPWLITQREEHLLFINWPVPAGTLTPHLPERVGLQTYEGQAYLAIIVSRLVDLRWRCLPPIPGTDDFPEIDLLTFVEIGGDAGIWFFRIDAANLVSSWVGSAIFQLPYHWSDVTMRSGRSGESGSRDWISVSSRSRGPGPRASFRARYRGVGPVFEAKPGSLDQFLVERFVMYARGRGGLWKGRESRPPRRLQRGECVIDENTMPAVAGIASPATDPILYYSPAVRVRTWPPMPIDW